MRGLSVINLEVTSPHLQRQGAFVRQRIKCLDKSFVGVELALIKQFGEVLDLVHWIDLHRCGINWVKDVSQHSYEAAAFFELKELLVAF